MKSDDVDYFIESVGEQLSLIFLTCTATLVAVGLILAVAL
jgi:hypothetical protein